MAASSFVFKILLLLIKFWMDWPQIILKTYWSVMTLVANYLQLNNKPSTWCSEPRANIKTQGERTFRWRHQGSGINYHTRSGFHHQRQRILLSRLCLIDISYFLSFSDLRLGTSANLINSDASSIIKNYLLPITVPFLCQKSNSCLLNKSDSGKAVYYRNPNFHVTRKPWVKDSRIASSLLPFK